MKKSKNILLTGSHRSGTTWTGKIIGTAKNVQYIHEPFNIAKRKHNSPLEYWFQHLSLNSQVREQKEIKSYVEKFYSPSFKILTTKLKKIRSLRGGYSLLLDYKRRLTQRALLKDPIAFMAAEWFYQELNFDVVVMIRHPAAFVASLKVKGWEFDFNNFSKQEDLMKIHLSAFEKEIVEIAEHQKDIISQGILLWKCIYSTVLYYSSKYEKQWYFVKHENLSQNPMNEFQKLFDFLDLEFTEDVKRNIEITTTSTENTAHQRNSKNNIKTWKTRLTLEEIDRIKEGTRATWENFYSNDDW